MALLKVVMQQVIQSKTVRRLSKHWLPIAIGVEVLLAVLYVLSVYRNGGKADPVLDFDALRSIPSYLQGVHLFLLGAIPLSMIFTSAPGEQRIAVPPSRALLGLAALFFIYASIDELVKLNQIFGQHHLWRFIYVGLGFSMPVLFYRDFIKLWRFHPRAMRLMAIGVAIFLVCGFGMEMFRAYVQQPYWYRLFGRWQFYQVDAIRTAIEEVGELMGESLLLQGVVQLAGRRLGVLQGKY